jgi:uncharacterized coiled-coil DUF342 family protein
MSLSRETAEIIIEIGSAQQDMCETVDRMTRQIEEQRERVRSTLVAYEEKITELKNKVRELETENEVLRLKADEDRQEILELLEIRRKTGEKLDQVISILYRQRRDNYDASHHRHAPEAEMSDNEADHTN